MDEETQKILEKQFAKLPENIQTAIVSAEYKTKLQEITDRQKLLIDQAGKLEMETTLVMIGLEPLADYTENLQRELGIDIIRAKEIAADVSENIFKPIRDSLYKINDMEDTGVEVTHSVENEDLDRERILSEIEDPSTIEIGKGVMIEPKREIEPVKTNVLESKLSGINIVTEQKIQTEPEVKLPPVEKTRPTSGFDPYREQIQ